VWNLLLLGLAGLCVLAMAAWSLKSGDVGQAIAMAAAIVATVFAVALVWRKPDLVVYGIFVAAITVETDSLGSGLSLTDRLPAFQNLQTLLPLPGLILNPIEALSLLSIGVLLVKTRVHPETRVLLGPLWLPFVLLMGVVFLGVFRGMQGGGDVRIALWGVRAMVLMFIAYVLTVSLVRRPEQLRMLFLLFVAGVSIKGLIGLWRFVVDFGGHISVETSTGLPGNSLMAHEESFFFLVALFLAVIAVAYGLPRRDRQLSLMAFGMTVVPLLANQRRVAIAAFVIAAVLLVIVMYALEPRRRRAILSLLMLCAVIVPIYGFATWDSEALIAMPTQAIKSQFAPDRRDASSDKYRDIENVNLRATAKESPLLGVGFGVPMTQEQILPNIRRSYTWYLYLPHNNILWLAMTMGLVGLCSFGWLTASVLMQTVAAIKASASDPRVRALFVLSLLTTAMFLTFALYDQGLLSQRICLFMGVQFGLLALVPRLTGATAQPSSSLPLLTSERIDADIRS
jgi:O-antigen ligase